METFNGGGDYAGVRAEIRRLCLNNEWDKAAELMKTLRHAQTTGAEFLVDNEEFYTRPIRSRNMKKVDKMLKKVNAKLLLEVRVARYEVVFRY